MSRTKCHHLCVTEQWGLQGKNQLYLLWILAWKCSGWQRPAPVLAMMWEGICTIPNLLGAARTAEDTTRFPSQISSVKLFFFIFLSAVWCWTWGPVKCPLCLTPLQCWAGWKHQSNMNGCQRQLHPCLTQPLTLGTHASHLILRGTDRQSQCKSTAPLLLS